MASFKHLFGRTIDYRFTPIADSDELSASSIVSARIYGPSTYPTQAQIEDAGLATTGHIERVTSWTATNEEGTGGVEYKISFTALADGSSHSDADYEIYYVAVNYKLESGGPTIFDVEQIQVWRPDSLTTKVRVSAQNVFDLESKIRDVAPDQEWVEVKIDTALKIIDLKLEAQGYKKRRTFNRDKLYLAALFLATALCCRDLSGEGNEFWFQKYGEYKELSDLALSQAAVGYDIGGDDQPGPDEQISIGGAVAIVR